MGEFVNGPAMRIASLIAAAVILALNVVLLLSAAGFDIPGLG